jgi:dipeptidyl aminopeptidase/acylaminoacyl peptidase
MFKAPDIEALLDRGRKSRASCDAPNAIGNVEWWPIVKRIGIAMALLQATPGLQAADVSVPIEAFAQLPKVSGAELSPDGRFFAYFRPIEGRRYMVIQPLGSTDRPVVIPPLEGVEFSWLRWANEERIVFAVAYYGKRGSTETTETRLLSLRYDATELAELIKPGRRDSSSLRGGVSAFFPPPQIQDDVIDWLPGEDNFILVSVDEDANAQSEVRKVDVRTGDYRIVRSESRGIQSWATDQDHSIRIGYGYDLIDGYRMTIRTVDGGWKPVDDEDWWENGLSPEAFSADPSVLYVMGSDERGLKTVSRLSIDTGEVIESVFTHDTVDAAGIAYDPVSGRPIGVRYVDDFPRIRYFDDEFQRLQRSLDRALPDTVNRIESMSKDRQQILVRAFSDVIPGSFLLWDREAGRMDFLAETMPGLSEENLSKVESHWIEAADGVRFEAFLTLPADRDSGPLPAVVLPHGGPASRDDREFWFLSQFLASRGYAVLQPNFRGSTGYGYAFQAAGRQQWGGLMQEDVSTATRWLISEGIADPERVCIVGSSYGGYAAAMGAIQAPELYRCAVSINGVLNLPRLIADDLQYIGGTEWTDHMGLDEARASAVSPYHQAERIEAPMLVIQAEDDTRVHADQGRNFSKRMEQLDKDIEYVEVEFGGHSMTNEAARLAILSSVESFLERHLAR